MEAMTTISLGSGIALVAILLQVIKLKTESRPRCRCYIRRSGRLKALYMRLEGYLKRTPPPV
jgi:hypothetical protein